MSKPCCTQKAPYPLEVVEGQDYWYCACGLGQKQPLCDGSHKGSGLAPIVHKAEKSGTLYFCGCRQSQNLPFCDGSHSRVS